MTVTGDGARRALETKAAGTALPEGVRARLESVLRADLGEVRVHEGPEAPCVGARAFASGAELYFAPGAFAPSEPAGLALLTHEACHAVQQRSAVPRPAAHAGVAVLADARLEAEADRAAARAVLAEFGRDGLSEAFRRLPETSRTATIAGRCQHAAAILGGLLPPEGSRLVQRVEAKVYCRFSSQGAWSGPFGEGANFMQGGGGINAIGDHAERSAWKEAWPRVREFVGANAENFGNDSAQVKFAVDAQICPDCQEWLVIHVIAHLKQLGPKAQLFAEVNGSSCRVSRDAQWPTEVAQYATYAAAKSAREGR